MKTLFVCWQNVSRSQIAAAYYNRLTHSHDADSAGTQVELPGETLQERRNRIGGTVAIELLAQDGMDIADNKKTQLTPAMLGRYDRIICMADKSVTPEWLKNSAKYIYWAISDPGAKDLAQAATARDEIVARIKELITL